MVWWSWMLVQLVMWCCTGVVAVLWWLWFTRPHVDAPGPPTLPIIGNILDFREMPVTLRRLRDLHRQYGDLTRIYLGPILMMIVAHPDDVQHILLTCKMAHRDPYTTHAIRIFAGDGIITNSGTQWKAHRKLINPVFHSELVESFLEAFHEGGIRLSERLARTKGAAIEIYRPAFLTTFRNLCNTVIGIDPDLLIPDASAEEELSAAMSDALTTIQKMMVRPWLQSKFLLQLTSKGRGLFRYSQMLQDWAMKCITMRSATTEEGSAKRRLCLLETLVKPGGQTAMPLGEVQDAIVNVMLSGTEAMAVTFSYVLAMLALHPQWQDAAHRELRDIFGEGDDYLRAASLADLGKLRVMESVIKETMRLFPALPVIPRVATEDFLLPRGRVLIPKGAMLAVVPFITHRMPEFFPDPLRFDPSRYLEDRSGKDHACSYLPFGVGVRSCVASQYSRLQLKVLLANVLRRFRILPHSLWEELEEGIVSITQHPVKPIRVSCVPFQEPRT